MSWAAIGLPLPSHHPVRLISASRGETRALQSILDLLLGPGPRTSQQVQAEGRNPPRHPAPPTAVSQPPLARAAGSNAEACPKLAGTLGTPSPPQLPGSPARGQSSRLIFHAPPPPRQTASLGDATVCAVPLKAAGSVLPFSTGCQNMQIRGPESAAK